MRNRPLPTIKRTNKMREKVRDVDSIYFHQYLIDEFKKEETQKRILTGRFVDDEQIEEILCKDDF